MFKHAKKQRILVLAGLFFSAMLLAACADETMGTPTLFPQRTVTATATPLPSEVARERVRTLFESQVASIQNEDWAAVYETCAPGFRASRAQERYVQDAAAQFARNGYVASGFEARNVEPFVRAPDRVRVRWDAFQDGEFIRTLEVGQTYVLTQGQWFDDGAWCR